MKQTRAFSLDALRGYAIMTMILSATEAFSILPAWMYHCQVPPPSHIFNPHIYGITWVDLIFPFFLFSMGAAIPLSFRHHIAEGVSSLHLAYKSVIRWLKLAFFAIFIAHMFPYMLAGGNAKYLVPVGAFVLMFFIYMKNPFKVSKIWARIINSAAYVIAALWMLFQPEAEGKAFSLYDSDAIILILSNMALFGSIVYLLTRKNTMTRLFIMLVVIALFVSAKTTGSWPKALHDYSPFPWLYRFSYIEYLLIIIPGTFAGDILFNWLNHNETEDKYQTRLKKIRSPFIFFISLLLIIGNVCFLYNRLLVINVIFSLILLAALYFLLRTDDTEMKTWSQLYHWGAWLLMIGLCFEPFEGGIRKDDVTISYLFTTSGLAFFGLLFFALVSDYYQCKWISLPLELVGKNPMIAYVMGSMVVIPLLEFSGIYQWMNIMDTAPWSGFLKGVILTALCMVLTSIFTREKIFWKT